jgi:hypothetical protein
MASALAQRLELATLQESVLSERDVHMEKLGLDLMDLKKIATSSPLGEVGEHVSMCTVSLQVRLGCADWAARRCRLCWITICQNLSNALVLDAEISAILWIPLLEVGVGLWVVWCMCIYGYACWSS